MIMSNRAWIGNGPSAIRRQSAHVRSRGLRSESDRPGADIARHLAQSKSIQSTDPIRHITSKSDVSSNVGLLGISGIVLLSLSSSRFDPKATFVQPTRERTVSNHQSRALVRIHCLSAQALRVLSIRSLCM